MITFLVAFITLALWYLFYRTFPNTLHADDVKVLAVISFVLVFVVRFVYRRFRRKETP